MSKKLKLDFYTFKFIRTRESDGRTVVLTDELNREDSLNYFQTIRNQCRDMGEGRLSTQLRNGNYVDILSFQNNQLFLRIGNPNAKSTLAIRNSTTLQSDPLSIGENQQVETFTFFFMDFNTGVLAHLFLQNAPRITSIRDFFLNGKTFIELAVILNPQTIQDIMNKDMVCSIKLKVSVPNDDVLENLGFSARDFTDINELRTKDVEFNFSAGKNKNIFHQTNSVVNFYNNAVNRFTEVKKFKIGARNEDERTEYYDLVNSKFTKSVNFEVDNVNDVSENEYMEKIFEAYSNVLPELRNILRIE